MTSVMIMYYVYILRCEDNSLYCGITTDVARRFSEHSSGDSLSAKYTRSRKAKSIEAVWSCIDRSSASKLEYRLKRLNHKQKKELIESPLIFEQLFLEKLETNLFTYEPHMLIKPCEVED